MSAEALLAEIDAWCEHTMRTPGELGQMVLYHGGFVPLLRKRGTLKPETATRIRAFMAHFPDRDALPDALVQKMVFEARAGSTWAPERHRSLMIKFGYPAHGGGYPPVATQPEGKPRISAAVIRAAKIDGRDLPVFVTALIDMGLECWRDDRVEHGEPVA